MSRGVGEVMILVLGDIGIVPQKKESKRIFKAHRGSPAGGAKRVFGVIVAARGSYGVQIGPIDAPWCGGGDGLGFG